MKSLLWSLLILIAFSSCKRCKNPKTFSFNEEADSYFDVFKAGNWWVYANQDSSKIDSIYVTNEFWGEVGSNGEGYNCDRRSLRNHTIHCKHLSNTGQLKILYYAEEKTTNFQMGPSEANSASAAAYLFINGKPDRSLILDSMEIRGKWFHWVLTRETIHNSFFARDIGIIRLINYTDTFDLVKSNITF